MKGTKYGSTLKPVPLWIIRHALGLETVLFSQNLLETSKHKSVTLMTGTKRREEERNNVYKLISSHLMQPKAKKNRFKRQWKSIDLRLILMGIEGAQVDTQTKSFICVLTEIKKLLSQIEIYLMININSRLRWSSTTIKRAQSNKERSHHNLSVNLEM